MNQAQIDIIGQRIADIIEKNSTISASFRGLRGLPSANLPLVVVVAGPATQSFQSGQTDLVVRTWDLNCFVKPISAGTQFEGYDLALDLLIELTDKFQSNHKLWLDAYDDSPDFIHNSRVAGDSGFTVFRFGGKEYAGCQINLSIITQSITTSKLP